MGRYIQHVKMNRDQGHLSSGFTVTVKTDRQWRLACAEGITTR